MSKLSVAEVVLEFEHIMRENEGKMSMGSKIICEVGSNAAGMTKDWRISWLLG